MGVFNLSTVLARLTVHYGFYRQGKNEKDAIVKHLLDFLAAPRLELLKGNKTKPSATKSSKAEDKDDEVIVRGSMPTDEQLRQWTQAYVRCFNMDKVTIRHALEVAGDKFGVDLTPKKDRLKEILTEEM
jgi:hypothetical protein